MSYRERRAGALQDLACRRLEPRGHIVIKALDVGGRAAGMRCSRSSRAISDAALFLLLWSSLKLRKLASVASDVVRSRLIWSSFRLLMDAFSTWIVVWW